MSQAEIPQPQTPRQQTIDIRIMIDTGSLPQPEDRSGGSAEPMSIAHHQGYMVVTASRAAKNQDAGDIVFEANAGDTLRFFISSGSNNFEQPVLIESIRSTGGDEILKDFTSQIVERTGIAPASRTEIFPAQLIERQFRFFQCTVAGSGTGSYDLVFALYDRNEEAQPHEASHYRWAMRLTVHSNRRES